MNITIVAGARPNFIKIAPIISAINDRKKAGYNINYRLVHTGQHYDKKMSGDFFEQLQIPEPNVNLEAGGGSQAEQTAAIMVGFEKELILNPCDLVLVVGDVTSTMACAIVAQKLCTKVAHVEAGIRSGDWRMPEEINRLVTDSITDFFFTTSEVANENLRTCGVSNEKIFFVGNTMIDTLYRQIPNLKKPNLWDELKLEKGKYVVVTLHRPNNVDEQTKLKRIIETIIEHSNNIPLVFPVHPRTKKILKNLDVNGPNIHFVEPLAYLEFNFLVKNCKAVITDSGGITEETTVMEIPCMTLRDTTERPETVTIGTNVLLGSDSTQIPGAMATLFSGKWKKGGIPPLWDGYAASRIIDHLIKILAVKKSINA